MATTTVITFPRGIDTPIMKEIEKVCSRLNQQGNAASHASFAGAEMYVCYSPDGVQLTFNRRLANLPVDLADCSPQLVRIQLTMADSGVPVGIYRRNGSTLIVEPAHYSPPPKKTVTVEGRTLRRANNLFQDFLDGRFPSSQQ